MSRSETAFETVARKLVLVRDHLPPSAAKVVDDAMDLLTSVSDLFYREAGAEERHSPGSFHVTLIDGDERDVFVVSKNPLSKEEKVELARRCSSPLDWSLCSGIKVTSVTQPHESGSPVYDGHGHFVGTVLDLPSTSDLSPGGASKGGAA